MEEKGFVSRSRDKSDERVVMVKISEKGMALREKALAVPSEMGKCINLSADEAKTLYGILYKLLG